MVWAPKTVNHSRERRQSPSRLAKVTGSGMGFVFTTLSQQNLQESWRNHLRWVFYCLRTFRSKKSSDAFLGEFTSDTWACERRAWLRNWFPSAALKGFSRVRLPHVQNCFVCFFNFKCAFNHVSSSPVNNSVHQNQTPNTRAVRICGLQTCEGFTRGIELVCTHRCWPATACQTHCLCQNSFAGINGDPFVPCDCIVEENRLDISLSLQDFWVIYLGSCYCDRIRLMLMRFFWYKTSPAERILFLLLH